MAEQTSFYAKTEIVADGQSDIFHIDFPYLAPEFIEVYINGVRDQGATVPSINIVRTSFIPEAGAIVQITRNTTLDRRVTFQNSSLLDDISLNEDSIQMLHIIQEAYDRMVNLMSRGTDYSWDAEGVPIRNLGDPVYETDAMNMRAAMSYLEASEVAKGSAETAESNALASAEKADRFANEAEDVEVEANRYSAKHWAMKAQAEAGHIDGMAVHDNTWHSADFETTTGAQVKADSAITEANNYTNNHENKINPHNVTTAQIGAETPLGAQSKADGARDQAVSSAKDYTDLEIGGLHTVAKSGSYGDLIDSSHNHSASDITSGTLSSSRLPDTVVTTNLSSGYQINKNGIDGAGIINFKT